MANRDPDHCRQQEKEKLAFRQSHGRQTIPVTKEKHQCDHGGGGVLADHGKGDHGVDTAHIPLDGQRVSGKEPPTHKSEHDPRHPGLAQRAAVKQDRPRRSSQHQHHRHQVRTRPDDLPLAGKQQVGTHGCEDHLTSQAEGQKTGIDLVVGACEGDLTDRVHQAGHQGGPPEPRRQSLADMADEQQRRPEHCRKAISPAVGCPGIDCLGEVPQEQRNARPAQQGQRDCERSGIGTYGGVGHEQEQWAGVRGSGFGVRRTPSAPEPLHPDSFVAARYTPFVWGSQITLCSWTWRRTFSPSARIHSASARGSRPRQPAIWAPGGCSLTGDIRTAPHRLTSA